MSAVMISAVIKPPADGDQISVHLHHSLHLLHSAESVYDHTLQHPHLYLPHLILSIFNLLVPTCLYNLRSGADVVVIAW